jgi:hypothetical protein
LKWAFSAHTDPHKLGTAKKHEPQINDGKCSRQQLWNIKENVASTKSKSRKEKILCKRA